MKFELVSLVLGFVLVSSLGFSVEYIAHDITLLIPAMGTPTVSEVYQIGLNSTEKKVFSRDFSSNITLSKLISWGTGPSFKVDITKYHVSYVLGEGGFAQVNLQYTAKNLLHKLKDLGNSEVIAVEGKDMVFYHNGSFVLPMKPVTQLMIQFPKSYRIEGMPQPRPDEERVLASIPGYLGEFYEYTWRGPLSSSGFEIKFIRPKLIQNQFTWAGMWEDLKYRFGNPLYLAAIIIIIILIYIYRRQIIDLLKEVFAEEPILDEES